MSPRWSSRLFRSLVGRSRPGRSQSGRTRQRRRILAESLESRRLLAVVGYNESFDGDLDADTSLPAFVLDSVGSNLWQGTLDTTAADAQDGFRIELAPGVSITNIQVGYVDNNAGPQPDSGVSVTADAVFRHVFAGTETVSAGSFSDINPTLPITNSDYVNALLAGVLFDASTAEPAADWTLQIDTVRVPLNPSITTPASVSVDENQTLVVDLETADDLSSEGGGLTYSLSGGADQALFAVDATTGVVSFLNAADFEAPSDADSDGVYAVQVQVEDADGLTDTLDLLVTVQDVNEPPTAEAGGPYTIEAGMDLSVDASGSFDPDAGDSLTYQWDLDADSVFDFVTTDAVATIPWLDVIDHIGVGTHSVNLTVTDSGGLSGTDQATVAIINPFVYSPVTDGVADEYTLVIDGPDLQVNDSGGTLLSRVPIATINQIVITGGDDDDTLTVDFSGGVIGVPITFAGRGGADAIVLKNDLPGAQVDSVEHRFFDESSGSITIVNGVHTEQIQYTGLEPIVDNLDAVDRTFTFTGGADTITLADVNANNDGINRIDSNLGEMVDFFTPSNSLTIHAGSESDQITVSALDSNSAFALLNVNGDDADDTITIDALAAGVTANLYGQAGSDTFNLNASSAGSQINAFGMDGGGAPGDGADLFQIPNWSDLEGAVSVTGESPQPASGTERSISAKNITVSQSYAAGDVLQITDRPSLSDLTYTLTDSTLASSGLANVLNYASIETLNVDVESGVDTFNIDSTADFTSTHVTTNSGGDILRVTSTGLESVLTIDTLDGDDVVTINGTGSDANPGDPEPDHGSLTFVNTAVGDDVVTVDASGDFSGIQIDTSDGDDTVTVDNTGAFSAVRVLLHDGDDTANIHGTGSVSATDIYGGDGSDTFNVSDDPNQTLDRINGAICVYGEDHTAGSDDESVSARRTIGDSVTRTTMVETGDTLNLSDRDASALVPLQYTLDATTFQRSDKAVVTYQTVETVAVILGAGDDTVAIENTAIATLLELDSRDGNDTVTVSTTGEASIARIRSSSGQDQIRVHASGDSSVLSLDSGTEDDSVLIASVGSGAGIQATTGSGSDSITLAEEATSPAPATRSVNAVIQIDSSLDADQFSVDEVFTRTIVDLNGGDDNDTFLLTAAGADAAGYLQRLNNDPLGTDDAIAASRQLFLEGGANNLASVANVNEGVDVVSKDVANSDQFVGFLTGDTVRVDATSSSLPLDLRYVITGGGQAVLATTRPQIPRAAEGNEVFETLGMEQVRFFSGSADDTLTIQSGVPIDLTASNQIVAFNGGAGDDVLEVAGTEFDDRITIGPDGGVLEPIEIDAVEGLRADGGGGNDQIGNLSVATAVLNGQAGNDDILGGDGRDLLTGGEGLDQMFGGGDDDFLFSDQNLGDQSVLLSDSEILNGGGQATASPGDVCVQFGADFIRDCETIGDGGGEKDVLSWLRGIFVDPNSISTNPLASTALIDFKGLSGTPKTLASVTEPSQIPFNAAPTTLAITTPPSPEYAPTDVNRDGVISPHDALLVINFLAKSQAAGVSGEQLLANAALDVNRNGTVEPRDALMVVNQLARTANHAAGEAEAAYVAAVDQVLASSAFTDDDESVGLAGLF